MKILQEKTNIEAAKAKNLAKIDHEKFNIEHEHEKFKLECEKFKLSIKMFLKVGFDCYYMFSVSLR